MLKKNKRIGVKEFKKTMSEGKSFKSNYFYLRVLQNETGRLLTGVAVSRRLAKKAYRRNYYKRLVRHILKESVPHFDTGYNIVITANDNVEGKSFEELVEDAKKLLRKAKIF